MVSITNCIQIILSEFVVDEIVHALASAIKTSINSKFILEIVQVSYSVGFFLPSGQLAEDWTIQTFQDSFWPVDKDL